MDYHSAIGGAKTSVPPSWVRPCEEVVVVVCSVLLEGKDQAVECKCVSPLFQLLEDESTSVRANCCGAIMMYVT